MVLEPIAVAAGVQTASDTWTNEVRGFAGGMDLYVCDILDMDRDVVCHQARLKLNRLQKEAANVYIRVRGGYVRRYFKFTILKNYMHRARAARARALAPSGEGRRAA
jgi:hypothetical protein